MSDKCELCGSDEKLTKHHLIPQIKAKNKYKNIKNAKSNLIMICELCHRTIHAYFSENDLRDNYNTKEKLEKSEKFHKYLIWRIKHLNFKSNSTKLSKKL